MRCRPATMRRLHELPVRVVKQYVGGQEIVVARHSSRRADRAHVLPR